MITLWPVQVAIVSALTTAPATYPVHDAVPQGATFPHIRIGPWVGLPDLELAVPSIDAALLVHGFSRSAGMKQAHEIMEFVRQRLNNQPIGAGVWAITEDDHDVGEDPTSTAASRLYHGWSRYRVRAV